MTLTDKRTPRMTLQTEAMAIICEECSAAAAKEFAMLSDDELRRRFLSFVQDSEWLGGEYDPVTMPRDEMIKLLADEAGGFPPTFAIPGDADDPLVLEAQELRRGGWERDVATTIKSMGLTGEAAARHRAVAEEMELNYLRGLTEETWNLPEANLRLRAIEIVAKLAGGADGGKRFPNDPDTLSRGQLLRAIGDHIQGLVWSFGNDHPLAGHVRQTPSDRRRGRAPVSHKDHHPGARGRHRHPLYGDDRLAR
jgi:hypothetical protein